MLLAVQEFASVVRSHTREGALGIGPSPAEGAVDGVAIGGSASGESCVDPKDRLDTGRKRPDGASSVGRPGED